jgi:hypothetical protein
MLNRTTDPGKGTAHKLRPSPSVRPRRQASPSPEPEFLSFNEGHSSRIDYLLLQPSSESSSGASASASPFLRPALLPQTPPRTLVLSPPRTLARSPSSRSPGSLPRATSGSNPAPRSPTWNSDLLSGDPVVTVTSRLVVRVLSLSFIQSPYLSATFTLCFCSLQHGAKTPLIQACVLQLLLHHGLTSAGTQASQGAVSSSGSGWHTQEGARCPLPIGG